MKFSLAYLTVPGIGPSELTYIAARAGYDHVSYRNISMHLPGEPDYGFVNDEIFAQTKRALAATGIGVHDLELGRVDAAVDPASYDEEFAKGAELGASSVISSVWSPGEQFQVDAFGKVCEVAAKHGLFVGLEFVPIAEVNTLPKAVALLKAVNAPNAGLMLDTYHVDRADTNLDELNDLPAEWFKFCHLADAPAEIPTGDALREELREKRLYVGEGHIPIADILSRIPEVVGSIEIPNLARMAELGRAEYATRNLEHAKEYFNQHPVTPRA